MNGLALAVDVGTTLVIVGVCVALIRGRISSRSGWLLLMGFALWVGSDSQWRIHSHHGLVHSSLVLALFEGGAPPENPFLAGELAGYPYGLHAILAGLRRVLPFAPPDGFAMANLLALGACGWLLDRGGRILGYPRKTRLWAILLALFGTSPVARGLLSSLSYRAGFPTEGRTVPVLKFLTVNANGVGWMLLLALMVGILSLWQNRTAGAAARATACVLAALGVCFVYPLLAPAAGVVLALAFLVEVRVFDPAAGRSLRVFLGGSILVALLGAMPWFAHLAELQQGGGSMVETGFGPAHLLRQVVVLASVIGVPAAVMIWARRSSPSLPWPRLAGPWLGASTLALCGAFLFLHLPTHTEYKWLMAAQLPLAWLAAPAFTRLQERRPWIAIGVLVALVMPAASWVGRQAVFSWRVLDPATTEGRQIVHLDPEQRALHEWLRNETPPNAVLVDAHLSLPAFAGRPLFVALDLRGAEGVDSNGVGLSAARWLREIQGGDPHRVQVRTQLAEEWFARSPTSAASLAGEMQGLLPNRPFFYVERDSKAGSLQGDPAFERVFASPSVQVYRLKVGGPGISTSWIH